MAVLGLRFCARAFSSCGEWGPLFIAVCGPLTIAASLVAEHRLQTRRLSCCGSCAQLLRGMWDLPRPGLEPVFPALAGRFSTLRHQGSPTLFIIKMTYLTLGSVWGPGSACFYQCFSEYGLFQHHLEACQKCRFSGPTPGPLNQAL